MLNADRSSTTRNKIVAGREISKVSRTNPSKGDRVFSSQEQSLYRIIGDLVDADRVLQGIVTYEGTGSDGGNPPKVQKVYTPLFIPEEAKELFKLGHRLIGWSTIPDSSISMYNPGQPYKTVETLMLHPVWTRGYMIKYNANAPSGSLSGVVPVDTYPYLLNDLVTLPEYTGQFTYLRNVFEEWNLNDNGQGRSISESFTLTSDMISENSYEVVLYAKWEASFIVTYVVTNIAGTELSRTQFPTKYIYKGIHVTKVAPTDPNDGRFDKWVVNDDTSREFEDLQEVTIYGNTTITTKWIPTFKVYYYRNPPVGKTVTGILPVDNVKHDKFSNVTILTRGDTPIEIYKYRFLGWNESSSASSGQTFEDNQFKNIQSDKHLYAIWEETYTVTYDGKGYNGGVLPVEPIQNTYVYPYPKGSIVSIIYPDVFLKNNYYFLGWNQIPSATTVQTFQNNKFGPIESDITLYAVWEDTYTITYYGQGQDVGVVVPVDTTNYRKNSVAPVNKPVITVFKKEGYRFLGWNQNSSATIAESFGDNFTIDQITKNYHLYAIWKKQYTITYASHLTYEGTIEPAKPYDIGQDIAISSLVPEREDYYFSGWSRRGSNPLVTYKNGDNTRDKILASDFTTDITLDAIWIELVGVIYNPNGNGDTTGNVPEIKHYQVGTANVPVEDNNGVPNLVKKGHTFEGWNSSTAYTSTSEYKYPNTFPILDNSPGLNIDIQLYANWSRNTYYLNYTTIDSTSGTPTVSSEEYLYGDVITYINTRGSLYKQGNLFTGWMNRATGLFYKEGLIGLSVQGLTMSDSDINLDPVWIVEYYSLEYDASEGSGVLPTGVTKELSTYIYGASVSVSANPTGEGINELNKRGHTFLGWKVNDTGDTLVAPQTFSITIDSILYAQWTLIPYTLTYNPVFITDTNVIYEDPTKYTIGESASIQDRETTLTKVGSTFKEWNSIRIGTGTGYSKTGTNSSIEFDNVNIILYAIWNCTVTYLSNDGNNTNTTETVINYENSQTRLTLPTPTYDARTGLTLYGWYTEGTPRSYYSSGTNPTTFAVTQDTTFNARWICNVTYSTLSSTGGLSPSNTFYDEGETFTLPNQNTLQRTNFTFAGWYTTINDIPTYYPVGYSFTITSHTTFYPIWACSVTYDGNGGNTGQTMPVDVGTQMVNRYVADATNDQKNTGLGLYLPGDTVTVVANNLLKNGNTADGWWYRTIPAGSKNYKKSTDLTNNTFPISTNTILYAKWTCKLTFTPGQGTMTTPLKIYENGDTVSITSADDPSLYGNTFNGWFTTSGLTGQSVTSFAIYTDTPLYAKYTPKPYTIRYSAQTSSTSTITGITGNTASTNGTYGITPSVKPAKNLFVRDGPDYRFIQWNAYDDDTELVVSDSNGTPFTYLSEDPIKTIPYNRNWVLYSQWAPTYRVRYNINLTGYTGNSIYYSTYAIYGELPPVLEDGYPSNSFSPALTSVTTHTFKEWYSNNTGVNGTSYGTRPEIRIDSSYIDIYAIWTCKITYMNESTIVYYSPDYINNTSQTLSTDVTFSKTGNTFDGWYYFSSSTSIIEYTLDSNATTSGYVTNENNYTVTKYPLSKPFVITANITLYAKWICKATFNDNGKTNGSVPDIITVTNNNGRNVVVVPGNTGSLQRNNSSLDTKIWYYMNGSTKTEVANGDNVSITTDTTFYANWKYTVTYNSNGGSSVTSSPLIRINEGFSVSNTVPVLANKTFSGWKSSDTSNTYSSNSSYPSNPDVAPSQNITLSAVWADNYTVTLDYNDGTTNTVILGTTFTTSPLQTYTNTTTPPRVGYTFTGWATNFDSASRLQTINQQITRSITFIAQWTIHTYTVTYNLGGVTLSTGSPTLPTGGQFTYNSDFTVSNNGLYYSVGTQLKRVTSWYYTISSGASISTQNDTSVLTSVGAQFDAKVPALASTGSTLTLYPVWSDAYAVTYDKGSNPTYPSDVTKVPTGSVTDSNSPYVSSLPVTTLTLAQSSGVSLVGHTLTGWTAGGTQYGLGVSYTSSISSTVSFVAKWTANTIQVTYNYSGISLSQNNSVTSATSGTYGSTLTITTSITPMRGTISGQNVVVTGWRYGQTGVATLTTINANANGNYIVTLDDYQMSIYPTWTNTYLIVYDTGGYTLNTGVLPTTISDGTNDIAVSGGQFTQGATYTVPPVILIGTLDSVYYRANSFKYYTTGADTPSYSTPSNSFTMPAYDITIVPDWGIVYSLAYDVGDYPLSAGYALPSYITSTSNVTTPSYFTSTTSLTIPPTTLIGTLNGLSYQATNFKYYTTGASGTITYTTITNPFNMPANNITIVPVWERLYTVDYNPNDAYTITTGSLPSYITSTSNFNTPTSFISTTSLTIPPTTLIGTLSGVYYTATSFKYYTTGATGTITYTTITNRTFNMPATNITIVPDWQPYTFTLQFNNDGKTIVSGALPTNITVDSASTNAQNTINVGFNSSVGITTPTLIGTLNGVSYQATSFKYYTTGATGTITYTTVTNPFNMPANNITIIPDWTLVYSITYTLSGFTSISGYSSLPSVSYVTPNSSHTIEANKYVGQVSSVNKIITSWVITGTGRTSATYNVFNTPTSGNNTVLSTSYSITNIGSNITITGTSTNAYSASYYNGSTLLFTNYYFNQGSLTEWFTHSTSTTVTPTTGQTFYGWNTSSTSTDYTNIYTVPITISVNTNYYLKWGYVLTFYPGDGQGDSSYESILPGYSYNFFEKSKPAGFTGPDTKSFAGWSTSLNGERLYQSIINSALTVYARWGNLSITYKNTFPAFPLTFTPPISERIVWYTNNETVTFLSLTNTASRNSSTTTFTYSKPTTTESNTAQRVFIGWNLIESTSANLTSNNRTNYGTMPATYPSITPYTITSSIVLYMCWAPRCTYTIYATAASGTGGSGTTVVINQYYGYSINFANYITNFSNNTLLVSGWAIKSTAAASTIVDLDAEDVYPMEASSINVYPYYNVPVIYHLNDCDLASGASLPVSRGYRSTSSFTVKKMATSIIPPYGLTFKGWINSLTTPTFYNSLTTQVDTISAPSTAITLYAAYGGTTTYIYNFTYYYPGTVSGTLPTSNTYYYNCTPRTPAAGNLKYNNNSLLLDWNTTINESTGYGIDTVQTAITRQSDDPSTITLYPIWGTSITYQNSSSGSYVSPTTATSTTQRYVIGYSVTKPKPSGFNPPSGSTNFIGWKGSADFTESLITTTTLTLTAQWSTAIASPSLFYKTYDYGTLNVPTEPKKMYTGQVITFAENPNGMSPPTGFDTFRGWRLIVNGSIPSGTKFNESNYVYPKNSRYTLPTISTNSNAYAAWGPAVITYYNDTTVAFLTNYYYNDSIVLKSGAALTPVTTTIPTGTAFYKWNTSSDGSGTYYVSDSTSYPAPTVEGTSSSNYLYATWGYSMTYNLNGGSITNGRTMIVDNHGYYNTKQITFKNNNNGDLTGPNGWGTLSGWRFSKNGTTSSYNEQNASFYAVNTILSLSGITTHSHLYTAWGPRAIINFDIGTGGGNPPPPIYYYYNDVVTLPTPDTTIMTLPANATKFYKWNESPSYISGPTHSSGTTISYTGNNNVVVTSNTTKTLYATYGYGVTYDMKGGSSQKYDYDGYYNNKTITFPTGFNGPANWLNFAGWRYNSLTDTPRNISFTFTNISTDITFYAAWGPYTIKYYASKDDTTPIHTVRYYYGDPAINYAAKSVITTYPSAVVTAGASFYKWNSSTTPSIGTQYSESTSFPTPSQQGTLDLYATYGYGVTYNMRGGEPQKYDYGGYYNNTTITLPTSTGLTAPSGTSLAFSGWRYNSQTDELRNTSYTFTNISTNITFYAAWGNLITIRYNNGNGSGFTDANRPTQTGYYNDTIATRDTTGFSGPNNYNFDGWYTNTNGGGTKYGSSYKISTTTSIIELYAYWVAPPATTYRVTYINSGGSGDYTVNVTENTTHTILANPQSWSRSNKQLSAWTTEVLGLDGVPTTINTVYSINKSYYINDHLNLYAVWVSSSARWNVIYRMNDKAGNRPEDSGNKYLWEAITLPYPNNYNQTSNAWRVGLNGSTHYYGSEFTRAGADSLVLYAIKRN
jgi:uncharacterized repeat protein (TIGR02543 family)